MFSSVPKLFPLQKIFLHIKPQQIWHHLQTSNIKKFDEREISFSIIFSVSLKGRGKVFPGTRSLNYVQTLLCFHISIGLVSRDWIMCGESDESWLRRSEGVLSEGLKLNFNFAVIRGEKYQCGNICWTRDPTLLSTSLVHPHSEPPSALGKFIFKTCFEQKITKIFRENLFSFSLAGITKESRRSFVRGDESENFAFSTNENCRKFLSREFQRENY